MRVIAKTNIKNAGVWYHAGDAFEAEEAEALIQSGLAEPAEPAAPKKPKVEEPKAEEPRPKRTPRRR